MVPILLFRVLWYGQDIWVGWSECAHAVDRGIDAFNVVHAEIFAYAVPVE
jgi:hypothetical protein